MASQPSNPDINLIQQKAQHLLDQLDLPAQTTVEYDQDSDYYHIQIETDTPGLLIGYRGETLAAFQLILGLIINQPARQKASVSKTSDPPNQTSSWKKIIVNVGDYRQRRADTLQQLAQNAAQRVAYSNEPYVFERLTPAERRVIHMTLKEHVEVETYSEGQGRSRRLIVAPK